MRKLYGWLTGAVLAFGSGWAAEPLPVPNPGLETEGTNGPAQWSWANGEKGEGDFHWVTEPVHGGTHAFLVSKKGATGHTILAGELVPVDAGKTYRVSAWVYPVRDVRRGVYFMISQYQAGTGAAQLPNTFGSTTQALCRGHWQPLTVRVTVREGNTHLRIQCIQAFVPSEIVWDDFEVVETGAEPPPRYEPPTSEPLPDLDPARVAVARRARAQVRVERQPGSGPRLVVDGQPVPWAFYVSPFWNPRDAQIADFRNAGVRVYLVPLVLGQGVYGDRGPWRGKDRYEFGEIDELLWRVLRVDPEGYILFYMACDPYRNWGVENPDHVTQDQNGQRAIVHMHPKRWGGDPKPPERFGPSLVSPKLREDVSRTLTRLAHHVESSEAGKSVIGYHVAGFNDGQWFQWAQLTETDPHLADYCPGAVASYRDWLRRRYNGDLAALRRAWAAPEVTFETATVPPAPRYWADDGLLDPATHQDVADYTGFYSEGVAESVLALARVLKQATPRPILCGTYYEDITCNSANHVALGRFLADDTLDYLAGPAAYSIRMPGYQGAVRSVFASTLLHGKTYLTEQDWRSWHSSPDSPENNFAWGRAETAEAHNAMVRRECGMMLALGLGTWWYDMSGGWFRDDQIMAGISEALRAFRRGLERTALPQADLAVFVSEDSNHYVAPRAGGAFRYSGILEQIHELNLSGVPYRLYLQSDLTHPDLPPHRAYLFLNAYRISEAERQAIEALKRDGRALAFIHAPGVVGAADPAATITALTGIGVKPAADLDSLALAPVEQAHPLLASLDGLLALPTGIRKPAFEVVDRQATALARFATGRTAIGAAARDFGTWRSVYVSSPGMSATFAHNLAQWSGGWCAAAPGDAVYANASIITIHALFPGHKTLALRQPSRVTDLTSGVVVAERTDKIELDLERGQTRWFWLDPR